MTSATVPIPQGATIGNPQTVPIPEGATIGQPDTSGQQTNDIGKTVIVPKDGESFEDTMNRGAAQGQQTTPQDVNDEMATAPGKVAETLAAAPAIGAAGAAALATPGEVMGGVRQIPGITETLLQQAEAKAAEWATAYPHLMKIAGALGVPTSTAAVLGWLFHSQSKK